MATRLFKLVTGEELIGQVSPPIEMMATDGPGYPRTPTTVNVTRVRTVTRLSMQTPQGVTFMNVLATFLAGSPTDNLPLRPEHVIIECDPDAELERVYLKEVSGIELATAIPRGRS